MSRQPRGMKTLLAEISKTHPDPIAELRDEDGFGVQRTVVLTPEVTVTYGPLLENLHDERVSVVTIEDGQAIVSFVTDIRADNKERFGLDVAVDVLTEESDDDEEIDEIDPERAEREAELREAPVGDLRRDYGYDGKSKKADMIREILEEEFGA